MDGFNEQNNLATNVNSNDTFPPTKVKEEEIEPVDNNAGKSLSDYLDGLNQSTTDANKKRKSNLVPLDAFFAAPVADDGGTPSEAKKVKVEDEKPSSTTATTVENSKQDKPKDELEEGELEEGELRELEEGELPEDVETIDSSRDISIITKSIPIDFDQFNRKRKVALLLSYCGAGFHGMQKNPEVETIELRLMEALAAIKAIRPDLKNEFLNNNNNQISFNRAARTDKGVSAARQVVSLKIVANEDFIKSVNDHLPKEIRVFGMERVTKTFDAKLSCSGRSYEYLVPSVAFAPSKEIMDSLFRLSDEHLAKVNSILSRYIGTHNFHNFTSGKRPTDKSAIRYITDFKASKPFECRGHEFVSLEVSGQSFLIHQIRKMIGLCMAICRGYCPEETVDKSWMEKKLDIPKAPGLGLLLNRVSFKAYNQKYGIDGQHNPLTWESSELDVERYKIEYLWHTIIEEEIKKSSLIHWLKTLNNHTYTDAGMNAPMHSDYKGKKGVFPTLRDNRRTPSHRDSVVYDPSRDGPPK